jgi:hypothetical protein
MGERATKETLMPRKVPDDITFDDAEQEVIFTRAALAADPDAEGFLPMTDGWMGLVDEARTAERKARVMAAEADAQRTVANSRLDQACVRFGDELFLDVSKDKTAPRWTKFFSHAVSRFVRQALPKQVQVVKGWIEAGSDPVLQKHKKDLSKWSDAADAALTKTRATAVARGDAWEKRAEMADSLTRERDGLHEALAAHARDKGLPRAWPDTFFRVERRGSGAETEAPETGAPTAGESAPGEAPAGG